MFNLSAKEKLLVHLREQIDKYHSLKNLPPDIFSQTGIVESIGLPPYLISKAIKVLLRRGLIEKRRYHVKTTGRFRNFYFLTMAGRQEAKELLEKIDKVIIRVRGKNEIKKMKITRLIEYLKDKEQNLKLGNSYIIKDDIIRAYECFKELQEKGYEGLVISDVPPQKLREEYGIDSRIYWLSEIEGENIINPFLVEHDLISILKKENRPLILIEGVDYLAQINGFKKCLRLLKVIVDMVAKNNGILILPIKLVAFSQKEIWLLSQHFKIYKPKEIPQTEINYTNILRNITPKCFFDIRTIFEPTKYVDYSERRPKIRFFSGRKKELKEIKDFLKSKSKILCVKGIAGIGKTTLVSKFIETVEMDIFWHRFSQFSTLRGLLTKFSEFLAKMDRRKLENYLEKERFELDEILIILEEELREANTLLIFDDFHKVNGEVVDFFAYLKNLEMDAKIIIMGREIPLFYDRRDVIIKKNIREIVLGGLDRESSIRLLKHRKIEKRLDEMYLATKGHPLLLELITPETETDVEKFIKEEIMNGLEYKEIKALEIASVFRCPFPGKAIMDDINYDILDNLVNKSLMQKYDGIYDLHDLIREFIYGRMTKEQKIENHKIAAEYYENEKGEGAIIEAIYHHIKAMRQKDAVKIAIENGTNLINKGFWKEFENVLGGISEEHAAVEHYTKLLSFKSDIYFRIGKWDTAITCIQQTIRLCKEINDKKQLAENYCKLGELLMNRGENENAKENIQKALNVFKDLNDAYGLARAHYCLGRVYWHIRELDDALMHLNSALSISEQINDQTLIAKCIMDIGNVYNLKGDYPCALQQYIKSLKASEKLGEQYEIARAYINMGEVYECMGDMDNAIAFYEKCIKVSEEVGCSLPLCYGLFSAAYIYTKKGNYTKAKDYNDQAMRISFRLKEKRITGYCCVNYGIIYCDLKEHEKSKRYFWKAIDIAEKIKFDELLSHAFFEFGKTYNQRGDRVDAKNMFRKSIEIYERLGNKKKIDEIRAEIEAL